MEQNSYKPLLFKHISEATKEAISYIKARKEHQIEPLKSRWNKFNYICGGGIEPGCVYTIAGASGTGKSSFVNTLETDLINLNPNKEVIVLSFSLEMLSSRQVGRKLSNRLRKTTLDLYSSKDNISDDTFEQITETAKEIANYPIYYVDEAADVQSIANTIAYFQETIAKDKWLIVILDHILLVEGEGESERAIISNLQRVFIKAKKVGTTSIIQLSQMNRNIETPDRINNPASHYPMRSDLSSSDSIFQGSDIVVVLSRPEILGITAYGPQRLPVNDKIYLHFLKQREGELAIIEYENNLKYNDLIEV